MQPEQSSDEDSGKNILEKLIHSEIISDVQDKEVLFPHNISLLPSRLEFVCKRV